MSGRERGHLSPVPGPYDEAVLAWLLEPEGVGSAGVMDRALAGLARTPQSRPRPWDRLMDSLRPEPFGTQMQHLGLLLAVAGLILALVAVGVAAGGALLGPDQSTTTPPSGPPVPSPSAEGSPASVAVFPLAGSPIEFVFNDGSHQTTGTSATGPLSVVRADGTGRREIGLDLKDDLVWPEWVPGTETVLALQGTFGTSNDQEQMWGIDAAGRARSQVVIPCVPPCLSRNEAAVSHDGSKIVFFQAWGPAVNGVPEQCGLSAYEFATQAISPITDHGCGPPEERHPRFSPDDHTLAFWRSNVDGDPAQDPNAGTAIFTRDLGTGEETQVTDWAMGATHLDWSPDGRWIVFVPRVWNVAAAGADVWRVHPDGSGLERLTTIDTSSSLLLRPLYSPDGRWIFFMRKDPSGGALLGIPSEGGTPVDVLPGIQVFEHDERLVP